MDAFAYLSLDLVIHSGHWRHLRQETGARPAPLVAAVVFDAIVLAGLIAYQAMNDRLLIAGFVAFAVVVAGSETLYMRRFSSAEVDAQPP